ncbi:FkbM family methyltransferase [Cryomorphaceae bacterium]|nr:FkbM family methyltransferase [Cryomorphaceae bacterium]
MSDFLREALKDGGTFIDVGANTGQTLLKVKSINEEVEYVGIEPNPVCVEYLKNLIELNQLSNARVFGHALSRDKDILNLKLRYSEDQLGTTTENFRVFTRYAIEVKVPAVTGDAFVTDHKLKQVDVIKLDIEGGESDVLQSFRKTIEQYRPSIICEVTPLQSKSKKVERFRQESAQSILQFCYELDYLVINLKTQVSVHVIDDFSKSLESCNYLLKPNSKE